jgi:hypothetical protein
MPSPTISQVHANFPLTDLSVAYFQESPPFSDMIFPRVTVDYPTNSFYKWNKDDFWRDDAQPHAPGDDYTQTKLTLTTDTYSVDEYGVEYAIPVQIGAAADRVLRLEQTGTRVVTDRLKVRKDRAFAADFLKTGVWATDKTGTADFVKWSDVTSDPSAVTQSAIETVLSATGDTEALRYVLLIGSDVRSYLVNHPDAQERIKYVEKADVRTVDGFLAAWLGVDDLVVARRRYTTSAEGAATATFGAIVSDQALLVAVPTSPGIETPSAGYTFEWNEAGSGPMLVEKYYREENRSDIVRGITWFDQKLVASDLGVYFNDVL